MSDDELLKNQFADKWRPRTLDQVVGQEVAKAEIRGIFKSKNIPNMIILSGPSGAGKTTLAYIIADLLNDSKLGSQDPDFMEYNLGDKTGVADARQIIQNAQFMPRKRFRVILLDEMHLASRQSMSALLKPFESPPKKTIWLVATNEPGKLVGVAFKRAIQIVLELPTPAEAYILLKRVAKKEKIKFGEEDKHKKFLMRIAETAMGEPRTALQILQKASNALAGSEDPKNALKNALQSISNVSNDLVAIKLLLCMYNGKTEKVIRTLTDIAGRDYVGVLNLLLDLNSFVLANVTDSPTYPSPSRRLLGEHLKQKPDLVKVIRLHDGLVSLRKEMSTYMVSEQHLMAARLGMLALDLISSNTKK